MLFKNINNLGQITILAVLARSYCLRNKNIRPYHHQEGETCSKVGFPSSAITHSSFQLLFLKEQPSQVLITHSCSDLCTKFIASQVFEMGRNLAIFLVIFLTGTLTNSSPNPRNPGNRNQLHDSTIQLKKSPVVYISAL